MAVTGKGQAIISTSTQRFEAFLANNSTFLNNSECLVFIKNIIHEEEQWKFDDDEILSYDVPVEKVLDKLINTFKNPEDANVGMINRILLNLSQKVLNRLYYKNNLYAFCRNEYIKGLLYVIIDTATPENFVNPEKVPACVKEEMKHLQKLLTEYVLYDYMIMDRVHRLKHEKRKSVVVIDTDSNMLNLEPWVKFIVNEVIDKDNYDKDKLRISILNTLIVVLTENVISSALDKIMVYSNVPDDRKPLLQMKNEYVYKRMIISNGKKNYTGSVQYKEGKWMNYMLDVKGLPLDKTTTNKEASKFFKDILKNDMLKSDKIDIPMILKKLQTFQEEIRESLLKGEKQFLKPTSCKEPKFYSDPLSQQEFRAVMNWNSAYPDRQIELPDSISIVKMTMTKEKDLEKIKDSYPDIYEGLKEEIFNSSNKKIADKGVYVLAIPRDEDVVPEWAVPFIDAETIIHDTMKNIVTILGVLEIDPISVSSADAHFSNIIRF